MLLASVLPNNAMMMALDQLGIARLGWKAHRSGCPSFFLKQSLDTMLLFWGGRPVSTPRWKNRYRSLAWNWAITWTLLLTVVPAWALNRLTTGEWVLQGCWARVKLPACTH